MRLIIFIILNFTIAFQIFSQDFRVDSIAIFGNKSTKDYIITRELTFKIGDTVTDSILAYNKDRVYSLGIFTKVDFVPIEFDSVNILNIIVDEAWYIWPQIFAYKKNNTSNKYSYGIRTKILNFRGRNELIDMINQFGYDNGFQLVYYAPYFLSSPYYGLYTKFSTLKTDNVSHEYKQLNNDTNFTLNNFILGNAITYRTDVFNSYTFGFFYNHYKIGKNYINKSIPSQNHNYNLSFSYSYDTRDLKQIPQQGNYHRIFLNTYFNENKSFYNSIKFDLRNYGHLYYNFSYKFRSVFAFLRGENIDFTNRLFIGLDDKIRGYTSSILEGYNLLLLQYELRHPLHDETYLDLNFKFLPKSLGRYRFQTFLQFFVDYGKTTFHFDQLLKKSSQYGIGVSLNFLFLPYDALRIEYAFNKYKKGEFIIEGGFSFWYWTIFFRFN